MVYVLFLPAVMQGRERWSALTAGSPVARRYAVSAGINAFPRNAKGGSKPPPYNTLFKANLPKNQVLVRGWYQLRWYRG